ncbi:hypothetical protein PTSG_05205 [Salpingoeca rosetta]|uniref:Uncharacterized protein n=1 Tax=Salpingoeca rosetta (strain ATCC 50818 / BSB-021) TaxID=946362 RepID=F2UAT6_SALR5|nr:uncharacterized protein PTSG_05205 [Salpingoeca rosetta]EGD73502.1 hypothetical protein PTSG_05205 [Salpingoeca rosetta]|eukprot:XP_004993784.1 hypothetical protein PTSG_05205 [Salpingoeca rosetta]
MANIAALEQQLLEAEAKQVEFLHSARERLAKAAGVLRETAARYTAWQRTRQRLHLKRQQLRTELLQAQQELRSKCDKLGISGTPLQSRGCQDGQALASWIQNTLQPTTLAFSSTPAAAIAKSQGDEWDTALQSSTAGLLEETRTALTKAEEEQRRLHQDPHIAEMARSLDTELSTLQSQGKQNIPVAELRKKALTPDQRERLVEQERQLELELNAFLIAVLGSDEDDDDDGEERRKSKQDSFGGNAGRPATSCSRSTPHRYHHKHHHREQSRHFHHPRVYEHDSPLSSSSSSLDHMHIHSLLNSS